MSEAIGGLSDERLARDREILRNEMRVAMDLETKEEKLALVASWKRNYTPTMVETLLRCARNRDAMKKIANWDLINWKRNK